MNFLAFIAVYLYKQRKILQVGKKIVTIMIINYLLFITYANPDWDVSSTAQIADKDDSDNVANLVRRSNEA